MRLKYTYHYPGTAVCIMQRAISDGLGVLSTRRVRVDELLRKFAMDGKFSEVEHGCSPERTDIPHELCEWGKRQAANEVPLGVLRALRSRGSNSESSVKRRPQVLT